MHRGRKSLPGMLGGCLNGGKPRSRFNGLGCMCELYFGYTYIFLLLLLCFYIHMSFYFILCFDSEMVVDRYPRTDCKEEKYLLKKYLLKSQR